MKKTTFSVALLLTSLLTLTQFTCIQFYDIPWHWAPTWSVAHLDNSGAEPVVTPEDAAPRRAYGIRLSNPVVADLSEFTDAGKADFNLFNDTTVTFTVLEVLAQSPFDTLPAGSNLSHLFRARLAPGAFSESSASGFQSLSKYLTLPEAVTALNVPNFKLLNDYHTDLLLLSPPPPGEYQFAVRLEFETRTDTAVSVFDTLLITNPIRLK